MWEARMEPGVLDAFERVWGTKDLLVSFDVLNITLPNRKDKPRKPAWEHVDQSPLRRVMHCVQGIINLSTAGPDNGGLMVYPGSRLLSDEFFETKTDKSTWDPKDIYHFDEQQLEWFASKGVHSHKVCADVSNLILWDGRTVHYGLEPLPSSNTVRMIIYAAYTPARLASPETLKTTAEVFRAWGGTTHMPHNNIRTRDTKTYLEDGIRDPRDRDEPLELPKLTSQLSRLAGVETY